MSATTPRTPSAPLTPSSPFHRRLRAYLAERFPLLAYGVLIVSYYSSNRFLALALTRPGEPMYYAPSSLLGAATLLLFFFHLRVFDEHKDYAEDVVHHPERVLSRGLVTLGQLRRLGIAAIVLEAALSAAAGPAAFAAWLAAFAFSLLMLKEFFVAHWLRRRFLLYATLHMLVMPLLAALVFSFTTGRWPWQAPGWFWVYAFVGFFVTFNWEVSRKIRAPEEEREGVTTYTRIFGTYGAAWVVLGIRAVDTLLVALVGWHLDLPAWFYAALVALYAVCLVGFLDFRLRTTPKTARRMEQYAGMYVIAFDLILAVALAHRSGIELWG